MQRDAIFSDCGLYRYLLVRSWAEGPRLLFIMLNPSTANALLDDATIRRCIAFARAHGYAGIEVVNLFAYRVTDPAELRRAGYPVGPDNDMHILMAAKRAGAVCVAWGAVAAADERIQHVMPILARRGIEPQCLHITRSGYPGHPLYLARTKRLQPFAPATIEAAMSAPRP